MSRRSTDERGPLAAEYREQIADTVGVAGGRVVGAGLVGLAVPEQIRCDDEVAFGRAGMTFDQVTELSPMPSISTIAGPDPRRPGMPADNDARPAGAAPTGEPAPRPASRTQPAMARQGPTESLTS